MVQCSLMHLGDFFWYLETLYFGKDRQNAIDDESERPQTIHGHLFRFSRFIWWPRHKSYQLLWNCYTESWRNAKIWKGEMCAYWQMCINQQQKTLLWRCRIAHKRTVVENYTWHMGYIDKGDRMANGNSVIQIMWTKKYFLSPVGFNNVEQLQYIILTSCGYKINHQKCYVTLVQNLLKENSRDRWASIQHMRKTKPTNQLNDLSWSSYQALAMLFMFSEEV